MTKETYNRATWIKARISALNAQHHRLKQIYNSVQVNEFDKVNISEILNEYSATLDVLVSIHEKEFKDL